MVLDNLLEEERGGFIPQIVAGFGKVVLPSLGNGIFCVK